MLTVNSAYRVVKPAAWKDRNHAPWPDVLARTYRTFGDAKVRLGEEMLSTTGDGQEAVFTLEVLGVGGVHNASLHVGVVSGRSMYRACNVYGGVVCGGVPCVLACYGSFKAKSTQKFNLWGPALDDAVYRFMLDAQGYQKRVTELRMRQVGRRGADAVLYRAYAERVLNPAELVRLNKERMPTGRESAWDLMRTVASGVGARPPIQYNPRCDQLTSLWKTLKNVRETCFSVKS